MKTCLVVDDSKVIRKVARHILETLNFEVSEAGDIGFQTGRWSAKGPAQDGGERPTAEGLIVTVHERQKDGSWKIRVHTFN